MDGTNDWLGEILTFANARIIVRRQALAGSSITTGALQFHVLPTLAKTVWRSCPNKLRNLYRYFLVIRRDDLDMLLEPATWNFMTV